MEVTLDPDAHVGFEYSQTIDDISLEMAFCGDRKTVSPLVLQYLTIARDFNLSESRFDVIREEWKQDLTDAVFWPPERRKHELFRILTWPYSFTLGQIWEEAAYGSQPCPGAPRPFFLTNESTS